MRVIDTDTDVDLSALTAQLWRAGIPHRVFEERGRQIVEIANPEHAPGARAVYDAWRTGSLAPVAIQARPSSLRTAGRALLRYPALTLILTVALCVFPFSLPLGEGQLNPLAALLLFVPQAGTPPGPWRLLTPIFMHFSVVHLAFNAAVLIELGRRIERDGSTLGLLLLVGFTGIVSNIAQAAVSAASAPFGGLSGVGYGLLGFLLALGRRRPADLRWQLPRGLAAGLLFFLVLFSTGITEIFGLPVANAAHWGGLVAGGLAGLFGPVPGRARSSSSE
ncbi:MAG: rhomboid family intramembrane serine protease [Pseudomonadales bacterium]